MPYGPDPIFAELKSAGLRSGYGDEWIRFGAVKYWADGSASERTMRMSTPFAGRSDDYGMLTMNQLSREQGVTLSTMTRVVDVLVRDGVLDRVGSPEDRRKVCIQLTGKGEELARTLKNCTEEYTGKILEQIPGEKHGQVIESMELLLKAIESSNPKCCF